MMSRPVMLLFLLAILIVTSQFEWKQELVNELEMNQGIPQKHQYLSNREDVVKEKIILSQEKIIQQLNELVEILQQELLQCRGRNNTVNNSANSLTAYINEIQRQQMVEDQIHRR